MAWSTVERSALIIVENQGLSNKTILRLMFARLEVLSVNLDLIKEYPESLYLALKTLSCLDRNGDCVRLRDFLNLMKDNPRILEFSIKIFSTLRQNLSSAPANECSDNA